MNNSQPIIRYKLPEVFGISNKCLGRCSIGTNYINKKPYYIIYVDINRIIDYCIYSAELGHNISFDQVFSHVFSHEYIHFLISKHVGNVETYTFDNIFGIMDSDSKYIYSGVKLEGDPLPKRHFYLIKVRGYMIFSE